MNGGRCPKCNGRVVDSREYVAGQCNFVKVRVCQICGNRKYGKTGDIDLERWSPDFPDQPKVKPVKREPIKMAKKPRRECASCKRVMSIVARGLCGGCVTKHKKEGTLDEKFPAARKRNPSNHVKKPEVAPGQIEETISHSASAISELHAEQQGDNELTIEFSDRDLELLEKVKAWATTERRTPEQQILFALENIIYERERDARLVAV